MTALSMVAQMDRESVVDSEIEQVAQLECHWEFESMDCWKVCYLGN